MKLIRKMLESDELDFRRKAQALHDFSVLLKKAAEGLMAEHGIELEAVEQPKPKVPAEIIERVSRQAAEAAIARFKDGSPISPEELRAMRDNPATRETYEHLANRAFLFSRFPDSYAEYAPVAKLFQRAGIHVGGIAH